MKLKLLTCSKLDRLALKLDCIHYEAKEAASFKGGGEAGEIETYI